jgi:hypothetical protein
MGISLHLLGQRTMIPSDSRLVHALAERKELSKTQLIRQAIRLYQLVDAKLERGERLFFENRRAESKGELVVP